MWSLAVWLSVWLLWLTVRLLWLSVWLALWLLRLSETAGRRTLRLLRLSETARLRSLRRLSFRLAEATCRRTLRMRHSDPLIEYFTLVYEDVDNNLWLLVPRPQ